VENDAASDTATTAHTYGSGAAGAGPGGSARTLAIVALIVALTAPYWEEPLLGSINIHLPAVRALAETTSALNRLDRRTTELDQQLGAVTAQLGKLQAELTQTTERANAAADRAGTLAMVGLGTALRRNGPFDLELASLRAVSPNQGEMKPLLDQIEPYAATGVPTVARLRQELSRQSSRIIWAERGFIPIAWVSRLLPWTHAGAAQPAAPADPAPQLLTQANAQLASGDLAGTVAIVQQIGEPHQEALADWIEDANARVAADAISQRLNDQIVQRAGGTAEKR